MRQKLLLAAIVVVVCLQSSNAMGQPVNSVAPMSEIERELWYEPEPFSTLESNAVSSPAVNRFAQRLNRREPARPSEAERLVDVPEPMVFDLVRPLGARRGELEINTLAIFPWRATNRDTSSDPFGPGPQTRDLKGIEWAPEIEYAIVDNFAVEFELPFEKSTLEAYKVAVQWTFGTSFDNRYIHGVQAIVEPTVEWEQWNSTLVYISGFRFDDTWSALTMIGGRINLRGDNKAESFERIINCALFADITDDITMGLETNFAARQVDREQFLLIPQIHLGLSPCFEVQAGLGFGVSTDAVQEAFIMRAIWFN